MSRPWMPFYVGDYLKDTGNLNTLGHGAYLLLIFHYWEHGGLPDDEEELAAICRLSMPEWQKMRQRLSRFFYDGWKHKRVEEELAKAADRYAKRAEAGKRGGNARANVKQNPSKPPSNATSKQGSNAVANGYQPQPHKGSSSELLAGTPRERLLQKLGSPEGFYEEGEFNNLVLKFPTVDIENRLTSYWPWGVRRGFQPHEIKASFYSTLEREAGSTSLVESRADKPAVQVSPQLATSRLAQRRTA